ncbi:ATP-binding protein [Paenibacillus turpanensis]|uniref:ATP-binding protein n=1 Tax=Paenibacillus turpanensis TaxID=2689078 RepID=UPI00140AC91E|nr:ATP-binding protein [Paenibacillus turpanensis]
MEPMSQIIQGFARSPRLADAERRVEQLANDPLVRKFRLKYPEIDDHTLKLNLSKLYLHVKEMGNCAKCPGLDKCPNDFEGHYTMLSADQAGGFWQIYDRKVACKKQVAKEKQDVIRKRIRSFYVDERALAEGYAFGDIVDTDLERADAIEQLMIYIQRTKSDGLQPEGLFLTGDHGRGKTFLVSYMLFELAKSGFSGVIVYMPDFVEDLKAMISEPVKLKEMVETLKEADLLVFDDVGAENLTPWVRDHVLGTILNYRMNRKPTFYTSNHSLEGFEKHLCFTSKDGEEEYKGRRLMERIRPFVEVIHVGGSNKRGKS